MATTQERWRAMLRENPVLPSPMCGISDFPFRSMCREFGAGLVYTQMVSCEGIVRSDAKTLDILDLPSDRSKEPVLGMQLFGCNPEHLAESARRLESMGAAVVDLNMGCPARKVTASEGGSALLRRPDLVREIFRAMRAALTVPFTAKMRWDWDEGEGAAIGIARIAEEEGVDGLCLHARTREEGYSDGSADWNRIHQLKEAVSIPVVGNGDVRTAAGALAMMRETGCDGVMIGRGVIGSPWVMRDALRAVGEGKAESEDAPMDWETRREIMLRHARLMAESKGEERGLKLFRKHAVAYLKGVQGVKAMRQRMMGVSDLDSLVGVLLSPIPFGHEVASVAVESLPLATSASADDAFE